MFSQLKPFCWVFFILTPLASAQEFEFYLYPVAANFTADSQILEVHWPRQMEGRSYYVGWVGYASGEIQKKLSVYGNSFLAWEGRNLVDLRTHPLWKGEVQKMGVNVSSTNARLIEPTLADEWAIFTAPEVVSGATSNYLHGHTLFTYKWVIWIWGLLIVITLLLHFVLKKNWAMSLAVAFGASLVLSDIRMIFDHYYATQTEGLHYKMVQGVKRATQTLSSQLEGKKWNLRNIHAPWGFHLQYRLAEYLQLPENQNGADFIFTTTSKKTDQLNLKVLKIVP